MHPFFYTSLKFLSSPIVSGILLGIFFLGFTYQLFSKRINIIGVLSVLSILIYFIVNILTKDSSLFALALLLLAIAFIVAEFFVIGLALGVVGLLLFMISIILISGKPIIMSFYLFIIIIFVLIEVGVLVKVKKKRIPFWKRLVLTEATDTESGYTSFDDRSYLLGKIGVTTAPLRPAGTVIIDDQRIDAVAEGAFIQGNVKVEVILVEGTRIVVRPIKHDEVEKL